MHELTFSAYVIILGLVLIGIYIFNWLINYIQTYYALAKFIIRDKIVNYLEIGKVEISDTTMTIIYYKNDVRYRVATPIALGVKNKNIKKATCKDDYYNNRLQEYLGPYRNFHGMSVTASMMGITESILVTYKGGDNIEYGVDDIILLDKSSNI